MGIRRACSYKATFTPPAAPAEYEEILVTIQQAGQNLVTKTKTDLTINADTVVLELSQQETAQFAAGVGAYIQIRCYKSIYNAPGSRCWPLDVWPALDDRILS